MASGYVGSIDDADIHQEFPGRLSDFEADVCISHSLVLGTVPCFQEGASI